MRREVLLVAAVALVAALGVMFALLGGADDDDGTAGTQATAIVAPANTGETTPSYAPQHTRLEGPYRDGVVSTITSTAIGLYDERKGEAVTFRIPRELIPRIDFAHLRADASSGVPFRIYYAEEGDDLLMRGFTHPGRGGD